MLRQALLSAFITIAAATTASASLVVNFDDASKWTAGSVALGSYASNHVYSDLGLTFTGGPALRENASLAQDGFAAAQGTYGWRLNQNTTVAWTATYSDIYDSNYVVEGFSFDVRRWDASPTPVRTVEFSIDGGATFTTVGTINNTFLGSSAYTNFSYTLTSPVEVQDGEFVVRIAGTGTSERIMIDNFTLAAIPEPTAALFGSLLAGAFGLMVARRPAGRE